MHYDIASKVILSHCKEAFLKFVCGISIKEAALIESKPQETPSLRRSDFVLKAILENGTKILVLIEFVSFWKDYIPLRTLETRCRHILQEELPVKSFIILLTPSSKVVNIYKDEEVEYRYTLIKLYEIKAEKILKIDVPCLYSFLPLMKGGKELLKEAETRIYEADISKREKADFLTGMAIFAGLISKELTLELIKRRRDIMIESAAYEIIKKEGYEEGLKAGFQQGIQQGLQQGLQQGIQQGIQQGLLKAIELGLKLKFGIEGLKLYPEIKKIKDPNFLEVICEAIDTAKDLSEIKKLLITQE